MFKIIQSLPGLCLNFMIKVSKHAVIVSVLILCYIVPASSQDKFELDQFNSEDRAAIEAAFFPAEAQQVVRVAHGAVLNKESWYFLCRKLQDVNIAALAIDFRGYGNSTTGSTNDKRNDIIAAVSYLVSREFTSINIIGGSMGGAAVLAAMPEIDSKVEKVVLMAPAGGPPIMSEEMSKLFIVSKEEGLYDRVKMIYRESADPKIIREFAGRAHAQHMFKEDYADELTHLIISFIQEK